MRTVVSIDPFIGLPSVWFDGEFLLAIGQLHVIPERDVLPGHWNPWGWRVGGEKRGVWGVKHADISVGPVWVLFAVRRPREASGLPSRIETPGGV